MKKITFVISALLLLFSGSAAAQDGTGWEQQTRSQSAQNPIQVQWLLIEGTTQRGRVFDIAKPDSGQIGDWLDLPLYQGIPRPCTNCRSPLASHIHYFDILAVVNIPGKGDAPCRLSVKVNKSYLMRTGLSVLAGPAVSVLAIGDYRWGIVGGAGWLVRDDNRQWRLSVTLTEPQ